MSYYITRNTPLFFIDEALRRLMPLPTANRFPPYRTPLRLLQGLEQLRQTGGHGMHVRYLSMRLGAGVAVVFSGIEKPKFEIQRRKLILI